MKQKPPSMSRIVEAAREEIFTSGVIGLRMSVVAAAAGTSIPLIYKYFGDRDGLVCEVFESIYSEYMREDILNAKKWLEINGGKDLIGPEMLALFPNPFSEHLRERRIWITRIIAATFELPDLRLKVEKIQEEADQEFDEIVATVHSLIKNRDHFPASVIRSMFRGLSFGHIFTELNYGHKPKDDDWEDLINFLLLTT